MAFEMLNLSDFRYRRNAMWEDAYRISKSDGNPAAMKQVAYEWAFNLAGPNGQGGGVIDSAIKLLVKLEMTESVIDIACDRAGGANAKEDGAQEISETNFQFAADLAKMACKKKTPYVHEKRAIWLEDLHKYHEAEEEFIKAEMPREAVLMHVHAQAWDDAARVAEQHDPSTMKLVLEAQGKKAFESGDFQKGEALLLRAEVPETAITYYRNANMWDDAIRLVREYVPIKLAEYEALRGGGSAGASGDNGAVTEAQRAAHKAEQEGRFADAVLEYLRVTVKDSTDHDALQQCWQSAVSIAQKFVPEQSSTVTATVGERLAQINRHSAAADLFLHCDMIREAVGVCMDGKLWERAREIATNHQPDMVATVDTRYGQSVRSAGSDANAEELLNVDASAGLDLMASRGDWKSCLRAAEKQGPSVLNKYAAMYAASLCKDRRSLEALEVFTKWGAPANEANFNVYVRLREPAPRDLGMYLHNLALARCADTGEFSTM